MLGHDIAAALPELQAQAESLMIDTAELVRPGAITFDPDANEDVPVDATTVYLGKARFRQRESDGTVVRTGGQDVTTVGLLVDLPLAVTDILDGDVIKCVASRDPRLTGRLFPVLSVRAASTALKRVVVVRDSQG